MTQALWKVPATWKWVRISDLGDVISGGTPSTKEPAFWGDEVVWFAPSDLTGYKAKFIAKGAKSLSLEGLNNSSARVMPAGTVMFSSRAPIGYVAISRVEAATNQGFKSVIPSGTVFNEYLYFYLKASKQLAEERATGTTFKEISGSAFSILPVPLPPLAEQHRIVAKIEALFSELDAGEDSLKRARAQLGLYRQSLLKAAFQGHLTSTGRNDEWPTERLGNVLTFLTSGSRGWADYYAESGELFIRAQNLKHDRLDLSDVAYVDLPGSATEGSRTRVQVGDVLVTITGANVTKTGFVTQDLGNAYVSQHVALCRPSPKLLPSFLYRFLLSETGGRRQLNSAAYGAGKPGLNLENIREVCIPLPSMKEQEEVVQVLEAALSELDATETEITTSLAKIAALRQAILKKAFSGTLVPQDPADEPASALLARIRAGATVTSSKRQNKAASKRIQKVLVNEG